jgi:hypothetical protein
MRLDPLISLRLQEDFNRDPAIIYASTTKVYGSNVKKINVLEKETRYIFEDKFKKAYRKPFR